MGARAKTSYHLSLFAGTFYPILEVLTIIAFVFGVANDALDGLLISSADNALFGIFVLAGLGLLRGYSLYKVLGVVQATDSDGEEDLVKLASKVDALFAYVQQGVDPRTRIVSGGRKISPWVLVAGLDHSGQWEEDRSRSEVALFEDVEKRWRTVVRSVRARLMMGEDSVFLYEMDVPLPTDQWMESKYPFISFERLNNGMKFTRNP